MTRTALLTLALSLCSFSAQACVSGAKCLTVPKDQQSDVLEIGDHLPRGKYQMLMNSRYMGLPRPDDGTIYFRVDHRILRVELATLRIVEDMTWVAGRVSR